MNKKIEVKEKNYFNSKELDFFEDFIDSFFEERGYLQSFVFKKTKRITAGIFLVTNSIPVEENIREKVRDKSLLILELVTSLVSLGETKEKNVQKPISIIFETLSLLEVAYISNMVSRSNFVILKEAYEDLADLIITRKSDIGESVFIDKDFFSIFETDVNENQKDMHKRQKDIKRTQEESNIQKDITSKGHQKDTSFKKSKTKEKSGVSNTLKEQREKISKRRALILDFIMKNQKAGVKEIAFSLNDWSSKTIQREINSMIKDGLIKKEGEKRWSVYSMK